MKRVPFTIFLLLPFLFICCDRGDNFEKVDDDMLVCPVVPEPSFPGGVNALHLFVRENLKYPSGDVEGSVFVSFVVNEDGVLSDFAVVKGLCGECDQNAIKALKKMPRWIPAKVDGEAIKVRFIYPVKFTI